MGGPGIQLRTIVTLVLPLDKGADIDRYSEEGILLGNCCVPLSKGVNPCLNPLFPKLELESKSVLKRKKKKRKSFENV